MSINRKKSWLLASVLLLLPASAAFAAGENVDRHFGEHVPPPPAYEPFEPFAEPDVSDYGSGPGPHNGFFVVFEGLTWQLSAPDPTTIGQENLTHVVFDGGGFRLQTSTLSTGFYEAEPIRGNQIEAGYMGEGDAGWMIRSINTDTLNLKIVASDVDVVLIDPPFGPFGFGLLDGFFGVDNDDDGTIDNDADIDGDGRFGRDGVDTDADGIPDTIDGIVDLDDVVKLPVRFPELFARNSSDLWSVEAMRTWRIPRTRHGFNLELGLGVRYQEFRDEFNVFGTGEQLRVGDGGGGGGGGGGGNNELGSFIVDSRWDTEAENNVVGPQAMLRLSKKWGRFGFAGEGRYTAGVNFQNVDQRGTFGSHLQPGEPGFPLAFGPTSYNHSFHTEEFSPIYEVKAVLSFDLTKRIALRGGWQGMYMDNIARPSNMVDYRLPSMGILPVNNRQDLWAQGLVFGLEWNR